MKIDMKLYTEEQVRDMLNIHVEFDSYTPNIDSGLAEYSPIELPSDLFCVNCDESKSTHSLCMDCIIRIGRENQIEISDKEIYKKAVFHDGSDYSLGHHKPSQ